MKEFPFADAILHQTDGGLQIIKDYYPDAASISETSSKSFKIRANEKTASATLKQTEKGIWLVADWGQWEKPKTAIAVCMYEDNLEFGEACKKLAKLYNIEYQNQTHTAKPIITKRASDKEEVPGTYTFGYNAEISAAELKIIGPEVTNGVASRFHLKSVKTMSYVTKENGVVITESTPEYPIFVYDFGSWQKIYQPKSTDKAFRFRYNGGRPKDYVFGLEDVKAAFKSNFDRVNREAGEFTPKEEDLKLDKIIIASGDRDALNVASFGYYVVWLNSETASLGADLFKELNTMANEVLNLPDIDRTGVKEGVKLGLQYLELKTIWLPKYLAQSKDWRGNPKKDFLDFINLKYNSQRPGIVKKAFKKLIANALPMKFWDEQITDKGKKYVYNIVHAEHFLKHQGFYRMETPHEKDEYVYVYIDGNIVKRTSPNKIENFVNNFLEERQMPIPLRNMVKKTPYLKEAMLSKLPVVEVDFKDCDASTQFWFFTKNVVEIKASGIKIHKKGVVDKMVIDEKVIDFPIKISDRKFEEAFQEKQFTIGTDTDGDMDITIVNKKNKYLNFLINASRIHWKKDLETSFKPNQHVEEAAYFKENKFNLAGSNLDADEILEQKQHLINKIYAIGYLLHKYKVKSKAWFVFGIDNKLSDIGESHGGSGKSLIYDYLETILKSQFFIPGRSKKAVDSDFLLDGVSKDTDYVFIDDMNQYFPFEQFFSEITGKMKVNPKGSTGFTINYEDSPKLCGTSNYPPMNLNQPSTSRRILLTVNSDYYHHNKDNEYKQTRRVSDDFEGKDLFDDFTESEYLDFYVFCAQALSFFLGCSNKIDPPMDNVNKRNLMAEMGDPFRNWADVYFSKEMNRLDEFVSRSTAYDDYKRSGKKNPTNFKKSVIAFCHLNLYVFNPPESGVKDGRIIKNIESKTQECFFIKTATVKLEDPLEGAGIY